MTTLSTKRRYTRLPEDQWAEVEAAWTSGSATLPELAHRFGVTERGIQARFAKRGLEKGSASKALAVQVAARVREAEVAQVDTLVERATVIRETTYAHATKIEALIMRALDAAASDPEKTFQAAASVKMFVNAASALERLHALKRTALGITDDMGDDDVPTFQVLNLTDREITAIRRRQDEEDMLAGDAQEASTSEDEEIVCEIEDCNV